jgi:DNA repair exonuclease SbcCD ATPase subunit
MLFVSQEEIDRTLQCPRCSLRFVDPRIILPCFETLCLKCIQYLCQDIKFNCFFCHVKHEIPEKGDGFPPDKSKAQMLNLQASEIYRGSNVEAFKEKCRRVAQLAGDFESSMDASPAIIKKHCLDLKAHIGTLVEKRIQDLHDMRDELYLKVNSYEQECLKNVQNINNKQQAATNNVQEAKTFSNELSEHLKKFKTNEDVSEKIQQADSHLARLDKLLDQLRGSQLSGKLLTFNENKLAITDLIGTFEVKRLDTLQDFKPLYDDFSLGLS